MYKILIIIIMITSLSTILNAKEPLSCMIKGGIIQKIDNRPYLIIKNSEKTKFIFSYNDKYKDSCAQGFENLSNINKFPLKSNRIYNIVFSIRDVNNGDILSIKEQLRINAKIKSREKSDETAVKIFIKSDMKEDRHMYAQSGKILEFNYYSEYITHIESFFDKTKVLDMYTSQNLSKNPVIKFILNKSFNKNKIKFDISNNKKLRRSFVNSYIQSELIVNRNKKMKEVFNSKTEKEAIIRMYGNIDSFKEGNITIKYPKIAENGAVVPLRVISDIDTESMMVLTDISYYPVVITIFSTPYNKTDYAIRMNLNYKELWQYTITVIIKDKKGNFYKLKQKAEVVHYSSCS